MFVYVCVCLCFGGECRVLFDSTNTTKQPQSRPQSSGQYTDGIQVRHQPFGVEIRNVQCRKCKKWGMLLMLLL